MTLFQVRVESHATGTGYRITQTLFTGSDSGRARKRYDEAVARLRDYASPCRAVLYALHPSSYQWQLEAETQA